MERRDLEIKAAAALELERRRTEGNTVWGIVCPKEGLLYCLTRDEKGSWVKTDRHPHIYAAAKLERAITTNKRFVVLIGGRASTKSVFAVDLCVSEARDSGARTYFLREFQSSIRNSVHSLVKSQIEKCKFRDFDVFDNHISIKGESVFEFAGIARNTDSVKSTHGFKRFAVEEAQFISQRSLNALTPTLRNDTEIGLPTKFREDSLLDGIEPEDLNNVSMIFVANPMSSADPFSKRFIEPYKRHLDRDGIYEDDIHLIIKINHDDNPWFDDSGLQEEKDWDYANRPRAEADHIWKGDYNDSVENAIIKAEWFDACVDAHKLDRLANAFKPYGAKVAAHDPFDDGNDAGGYALRHGSIIKKVKSKTTGEIDETCDWATGNATKDGADWFVWDGDGMGTGLKRQVSLAFNGTKTKYQIFRGSLSGSGQDNADKIYMPAEGDKDTDPKTYAETFKNNRSQYYIGELARRCYNTYLCVEKGHYIDPDDMISFDSEGIEDIVGLRAQLCRVPRKHGPNGLEQVMSKQDMAKLDIKSPNEGDSVMMSLFKPPVKKARKAIKYPKASIA